MSQQSKCCRSIKKTSQATRLRNQEVIWKFHILTLFFRISSNFSVSSPEGKGKGTVEYFFIQLLILNNSCHFSSLGNLHQQPSLLPIRYITLQLAGSNKRTFLLLQIFLKMKIRVLFTRCQQKALRKRRQTEYTYSKYDIFLPLLQSGGPTIWEIC